MRSVLAFLGAYLYVGYRVVELPVLIVLYLLLATVISVKYVNRLKKTFPKKYRRAICSVKECAKQLFLYRHKLQNWVLHR